MSACAIAIHGGCGVMPLSGLDAAEWDAARADLAAALRAGWALLCAGGRALDAVETAVLVLEDSPHFNAAHGAALNAAGEVELDAAIMDGATLAFGAVAAARRIRNPVRAARAVLDSGSMALVVGNAADTFAERHGIAIVDPAYFLTPRRRANLKSMQAHAKSGTASSEAEKHGTVGAVALDRHGDLAAATSTGGYTNKPEGRVGDSPIAGAGTYARNGVCAVSGTGKGELFLRHLVGHEVASRMAYLGETLDAACRQVILHDLAPYQAGAGLIGVDATGAITTPYNTEGMFRGWVSVDGELTVATHDVETRIERLPC